VVEWTRLLEDLHSLNSRLTAREEEVLKLQQKSRKLSSRGERVVVAELEELLAIPPGAIHSELHLSKEEVESLITAITSTMEESRRVERELVDLEERKAAGDIYIRSLVTDLESAEQEGEELQREFDWLLTLPPSAFASPEMLDWLRRDVAASGSTCGDTDSELGLELSHCQGRDPWQGLQGGLDHPWQGLEGGLDQPCSLPFSSLPGAGVLLPDQVHPHSSPDTSADPARSSSTGSTSSGFSSDVHSLQSPEPTKPPLPPKRQGSMAPAYSPSSLPSSFSSPQTILPSRTHKLVGLEPKPKMRLKGIQNMKVKLFLSKQYTHEKILYGSKSL